MLDEKQISLLGDEEKNRYKKLEETFATAGWPLIKAFALQNVELAKDRALTAKNWDQHLASRIQMLEFTRWATLEESIEAEFAALAAQAEEDANTEEELEAQ